MDELLSRASNQAMTFAIRSSITFASGFALKTLSRFLDKIPDAQSHPIYKSKARLDLKIRSILDLMSVIKIENVTKNSILQPTVDLIDDLDRDIESFDRRMKEVMETTNSKNTKESVKLIEAELLKLHAALNEIVPFINLAITAIGLNIKTTLPTTLSLSKLLHASQCFTPRATHADLEPVGPMFDFKLFSVFYNPSRLKYVDGLSALLNAITWKEEFARCLVQLIRKRGTSCQFYYQLLVEENLDDGLYHENERPQKKQYLIKAVVSQYFTASGKLLRLESSNSPLIVLKISNGPGYDYVAFSSTDMFSKSDEKDESDEDFESGESDDGDNNSNSLSKKGSKLQSSRVKETYEKEGEEVNDDLGLFQYLIKLAAVEEIEQRALLNISDEKLMLLLLDSTGNIKNLTDSQAPVRDQPATEGKIALESNTKRLENLNLDS